MHEYPITEQIIKIAGEHCKKSGGSRVTKVNLVIGDYPDMWANRSRCTST